MKYTSISLLFVALAATTGLTAQPLNRVQLKAFEHQLDDVMEVIDTSALKQKRTEVEAQYQQSPTAINKVRLGIIYHETALNFSFLAKGALKGYAQKSYAVLTELLNDSGTVRELLPFISVYRASALALVSAESSNLKLLGEAFRLFEEAEQQYAEVSYLPEFLRGSVAENLPWFFFRKRKFAKHDFQSIIHKNNSNDEYANWKIMSFTYWAWANQRQGKQHRKQAIAYLDKAIALDPNYKAGRERAERLKSKLIK